MKKLIIIFISFFTFVFMMMIITCGIYLQKGMASVLVGSQSSESDNLGICKYISSDVNFKENIEAQREKVSKMVPSYYVNATLGIYSNDIESGIDTVIDKVKYLIKKGDKADIGTFIQEYKYGIEYGKYLKENSLENTLAVSKQYFNEHYKNKDKDREAYLFFKKVLSLINKDCNVISVDGEWSVPMEKPYTITQEFGITDFSGGLHYGIDLSKGYGSKLYAVHDGVIAETAGRCTPNGGYIGNTCNGSRGNYVYLKVGDGKNTVYVEYFHMETILVKEGDKVIVGEEIGTQGNSGNSSGSHLHLEMNSKPTVSNKEAVLDPNAYIDFYK